MPTTRPGKKHSIFIKKRALFIEKRALFGKKRALFGKKRALFGKKGSHLKHISAPWRMLGILFFVVDTRQMILLRVLQTTIDKRPRKALNFDAPIDRFYKKVAWLT
jgi:hypothetical protein